MNIGWQELLIVFLVLLLLFGPKMPEIGRSLGKGIKSFKDGLSGIDDEHPSTPAPPPERDAAPDDDGDDRSTPPAG